MSEVSVYRRILSGEAGGWATPVRAMLRLVEFGYAAAVDARNRRFDRSGPLVTLPCPLISIGNITVGGTGKTPLVIDLVRRLERIGRNPAVLSRGYKAAGDEPNDEEKLIRKNCPGVVCVADPDRAAGGQRAIEEFGADVLVLDDGFQHRRLARTLDVVVIDATCPFGFDHVLPRGLLRERAAGLRRANVIVLTRVDQVSHQQLERIRERTRRLAPDAVHLACRHHVSSVESLNGSPINAVGEKRAVLFAGVGHPGAFVTTARRLGVEVVGTRWFPDHHRYSRADVAALVAGKSFPPHDLLLTTEKDAVKLTDLDDGARATIGVVKIGIDFCDGDDRIWASVLGKAINGD